MSNTVEQPVNEYQRAILFALNRLGKHIYHGTVPDAVKAKRRRQNTAARASRKLNRA